MSPSRGEPKLLWTPSAETVERATLTRYQQWLERERGLAFEDYHALWRWSVQDIETFWASVWDFFDVRSSTPYTHVLGSREMPGARWFPGAELSYAEHVFRDKDDAEVAIVAASELGADQAMTWAELRALTAAIANGLLERGVGRGDRVAGYLPNIPETVACFLACASVGATWSCCSPDFGVGSVVDRFGQIEPKILLAIDGYSYGGRAFDRRDIVAQLQTELPSVTETFVLPYLGSDGSWDDLMRPGELSFAHLPFDHPLWVLYSSGTTGLPKPIVHSQGGILLEHLKTVHLHFDARAGDRVFWFTSTGWMMWNLVVGVLLSESAIVLFDGNPAHPDMGRLWDLAESASVTCFGTSAAFVSASMKEGVEPRQGRDLGALRSVGSTGSPLAPEGFAWVYDHVGDDVWLFSTSGGTDVCSAFVGGVPTLPVYQGELQARSLGASVEAFDTSGRPVIDEVGELVLTQPMPSMPVFLWGDTDGSRYEETYFDTFPGVWRHGDWIEITSRGTAIIYGRSDATINRGGIRMGTSEIYRAVLALPEVHDAIVVDLPREGTEGWMPLFVVLREGGALDDELVASIKRRIREECSPRHVPNEVRQIAAVPRTLSGKVVEVPVKRILMGVPPETAASLDSLANPEALDYFVELARATASSGSGQT